MTMMLLFVEKFLWPNLIKAQKEVVGGNITDCLNERQILKFKITALKQLLKV